MTAAPLCASRVMGAPPSPDAAAGGHAPHACLDEELDPAELTMLRNVQRKFIACTYRGGGAAGGNRGDLIKLFRLLDTDHSGTLDVGELHALAHAIQRHRATKQAGGEGANIPLQLFPTNIRSKMAVFDSNSDGCVDAAELASAARMYAAVEDDVRRKGKILMVLVAAVAVVICAMGGVAFWVLDAQKDMQVRNPTLRA